MVQATSKQVKEEAHQQQPEAMEQEPQSKPVDAYHHFYALSAVSLEEATRYLAGVLDLPDFESNPRSAAKLDYISYALRFAQEACFGPRRVNALISIAHSLLEATIAGASCAEVQATLQAKLLAATSPRPGADSELFSPDQVAQVAHYFARTFFRHFRLYSYLYSTLQDVAESTASLLVETAIVPSFETALSESEWQQAQEEKRQAEEAAAEEARKQKEAVDEAEAARAAEEAAARAEEQRQADLQRKPATLEDAIEHMVAVRLEAEKKILSDEYTSKEDTLLRRIAELEARAAPPASAGTKKRQQQASSPS